MKHVTATRVIGLTCCITLQKQTHRARLFWRTLSPDERTQCEAMEAELQRREMLAVTAVDMEPSAMAGPILRSD